MYQEGFCCQFVIIVRTFYNPIKSDRSIVTIDRYNPTYYMFSDCFQFSRHGIPLSGLIQPHFVPVQNQDLDFPGHIAWSFYMYNDLRWEVIVRFVNFGRFIDHRCFNFPFIIISLTISFMYSIRRMLFPPLCPSQKKFVRVIPIS